MSLSNLTYNTNFSHIYIEKGAYSYALTAKIKDKFKQACFVEIEHYKDIFNAPSQNFRDQKKRMALILAVKPEPYLYKGSYLSDGFGFDNFYYVSSMQNCLYDCDYCYLQGMYPSGNMLIFVNTTDFLEASKVLLDKPTLIAVSYDTDTLALENIAGHSNEWIEFAKNKPNLHLEIRTKSANFKSIAHHQASSNIILAWTLSPEAIIEEFEPKTPALNQRLKALKQAMDNNWLVRISIDPMIWTENFVENYETLIDNIFTVVDPNKLHQLTIGAFRMSIGHLKKIKKMEHTALAFYPYTVQNGSAMYDKNKNTFMVQTVFNKALNYISEDKIRVWVDA